MKKLSTRSPIEKRFRPSKLYALICLVLPSIYAHAQDIYEWNGSVDQTVGSETGNWTLVGTDPSSFYNLGVINSNTSATGERPTWVLDNNSYQIEVAPGITAQGLMVGQGNGSNGVVDIKIADYDEMNPTSPGYLSQLHIGTQGGIGEVNIYHNDTYNDYYHARVLDVSGDNSFLIGSGAGSQGTVNILGAGKTTDMQRDMMATLSASSWGSGNDIAVGLNGGQGTVNIEGGSMDIRTSDNKFLLGSGSGSQGNINVLGGGKVGHNLMMNGVDQDGIAAVIGDNGGHGVLKIEGLSSTNGAISRGVLGSGVTLGKGSGSLGEIYIKDGAELVTADGAYWDNATSDMAYTQNQLGVDGGTGRAVINGAGSIWKVIGQTYFSGGMPGEIGSLYVGQSGVGDVTVSNGGKLSIGQSEYDYINESDPITGNNKFYYYELDHIGGTGTLYLAAQAGSTGTVNIGSAEGLNATGAGVLDTKEIIFGNGTGTIVFNHTDNTGEYVFDQYDDNGTLRDTNQLVGDGTLKNIKGVTVLNTDQSTFTGKIFASGGVLEVNNVLGGTMEVNGSGTLAGVGTVGNTTVKSGGTLSPGKYNDTSASTLTVDGDLNMNAGSTLSVNISPELNSGGIYGESDLVDVLGQANINGAKVHVNKLAGSYIIDTKWNILSAAGGVAGTFGELSQNRPFVSLGYEYDANNAYLVVTRNATGYCVDGMSFNQCSAGNNIDGQGASSLLNNVIAGQTSIDAAKRAFDLLSGEIHASAKGAALEDSRFLREAMNNRMQDTIKAGQTGTWAHAFGSWGTFDGDGNAADMKRDISGVFFGVDAAANDTWQLGMVAGYSYADIKADQRKSSADRDDYHIGAYTSAKWGQTSFRAGVGHTLHEYSTNRNVNIEGLSENLTAKYDANTTQVFAEGSHKVPFGLATVEPFVNAAYVNHYSENFTEKGGIAGLSSGSDNTEMFYTTIGARLVTNFKLSNTSSLKAWGMAGWRHAYNSVTPDANLNFQGEQGFNIRGTPIARDVAALELGLEATVTPTVKVGLMYNGQVGSKVSDHGAKAYLNWIF